MAGASEQSFAFLYSPWLKWLFVLIFAGPKRSRVDVTADEVSVRMGPWFRVAIPRRSITRAARAPNVWWAIGVHTSFTGIWWVNGSAKGMVALDLDPRPPGRALGFRIHPKHVELGVEEPERFLQALGFGPDHAPRS